MENTTVVKSYVRGIKQQSNVEPDNTIAYVLGGSAVIMLAITHIGIVLITLASIGSLYGVKTLISTHKAVKVEQSATQAVEASETKPKRHYQKRLTVHDYQTGKTIKV